MRRNLELLSKEDEDQLVDLKEKVKEQEEEAYVLSKISMKNEVVEVFEPENAYLHKPLEMQREHENSQPPQTSLNQRFSTLESVIERYEEEMKKSWEEQQASSMKVLLNQMLSAKEEVEEQESEKDNQGSPYSSEVEICIEEGLIEPSMQGAPDEENTQKITQPPSFDIQEVKATNNNTEKRIVTKPQLIISMKKKRSTTNNPTPDPASKFNPANNKRKLAEERPRKGTLTGFSLPLRIFYEIFEIMKTLKKQMQLRQEKQKGKNEKAEGSEYQ
ncbi:hypothetical protein AHAS_Ahas16G0193500 [Arachis hypogaea]